MKNNEEKEFLSFIQESGLIWGPEPEIYGGLAGLYTYGPLGKLLKNKIEDSVRKVFNTHNFREIEGPTIMPDIVWNASGHLETFKDKIITDNSGAKHRADKLVEETIKKSADHLSNKELLDLIKKHNIKSPSGHTLIPKITDQSLMMKTNIAGTEASLRPETATVTYLPFLNYYNHFRKKLPFAVFQIGKAYRNEISPRQHVLRMREFTQAEAQIFIDPKEKNNFPSYEKIKKEVISLLDHKSNKAISITIEQALKKKLINSQAYAWCLHIAYTQFLHFGIPKEKIRLRQHHPDEKAFYAEDAWDIEINLNNFSWTEVCGVHDRTDYDLKQHSKSSKIKLEAKRDNGETFTPHVLEIAFGTDRPTYALIDLFYDKKSEKEGKTMFKVPYNMAPVEVSIFPLMKKPDLIKIAAKLKKDLEKYFIVEHDLTGSIGRRYLRSATQGTPFAITIDFDSIKNKDVTVRDRDTEKQIRVPIENLQNTINLLISKEIKFEKAGKLFT
jgi:glycyl-tRNA synthetase